MLNNFLNVKGSAAPFLCPMAPFMQPLCPAFGHISEMDFFPEGIFLSSKTKAAAFFDASVETLDKWIARGMITPFKRGRAYFFPVEGLAQAMNHPAICEFIKNKALENASDRKKKKISVKPGISYWVIPIPGSELMFLLIRCNRNYIGCPCTPSVVKDEKFRKAFISQILSLYRLCMPLKPSYYEKN